MFKKQTFNALAEEPKPKRTFLNLPPYLLFIFDLIKLMVIAFIIVWPIHRFIFQPFYVVGPSMEPNFYDNEYLIIEKTSYYLTEPKRGEVIVFQSPANPENYLIKRIIGLPNEKLTIEKGEIYIYNNSFPQGLVLDEQGYLSPGTVTPGSIDVQLSENEYYVLGDNRNMSLDSRVFGSVKQEYITGRAWFRGWPFENMGLLKNPVFAY